MTEHFANQASDFLKTPLGPSDTTATIKSTAKMPATPFRARCGTEIMLVDSLASGTTYNVTRALEGTSAIAHPVNAVFQHVLTAAALVSGFISDAQAAKLASTYEPCHYAATQLVVTADLTSATLNGKLDLAGNTPTASDRALLPIAGTSALLGIYVYSGTAWVLDPNFTVRLNARVNVGLLTYVQTAATGSGTVVFVVEPINLDGTTNKTINARGHAIIDFNNKMGVNVSCTTTTPTQLLTSIFGVESAAGEMTANHTYVCTIGIRITLWETATPTVAGNIDIVIDAVVVTDGSNLPTVAFNTTPAPDASRLPSALSTAAATCTALAAGLGYSVSLTQSSGVTCTAIARTWINRMVEVA